MTLIQEIFAHVFEKDGFDEAVCEKYFSKDYIQYVDGKKVDYAGFLDHVRALKSALHSMSFEFKHIVKEGNKIATLHIARGIKKDTGKKIEVQVNAMFEIQNNQVISCNELTHLVHGEESDQDLGSRV
ncbi:MAG: nuclear transport factor 2 family protein [Gammaproteobacteria bacterium]|nr:nuclear transport factor 2 family protein [Gammaproteobacteria bacterium]